ARRTYECILSVRRTTTPLMGRRSTHSTSGSSAYSGRTILRHPSSLRRNFQLLALTRSTHVAWYQAHFLVSRRVVTASHSRGSPMAASTLIFCHTASGRPSV